MQGISVARAVIYLKALITQQTLEPTAAFQTQPIALAK